jgi:SAM-dependent methyltransferase
MNRSDWLIEKRRETEERYTTFWALDYGEKWGLYPNASHQQFLEKFLSFLPAHSAILDAACGAGRYMPMLLENDYTVIGIDQSQGMLDSAKKNFPNVEMKKIGLQEMSFDKSFDGAICMDAMEHIFPEDWVPIFYNFHRALKPHGYFYFTVEIADEKEVEEAFTKGKEQRLPIVYGEWAENDGVYHYYPSMGQVREWLQQTRFDLMEEGEGDGYHHFMVRKA